MHWERTPRRRVYQRGLSVLKLLGYSNDPVNPRLGIANLQRECPTKNDLESVNGPW